MLKVIMSLSYTPDRAQWYYTPDAGVSDGFFLPWILMLDHAKSLFYNPLVGSVYWWSSFSDTPNEQGFMLHPWS